MFERKWNIGKLYLAYPALLTSDFYRSSFFYNETEEELMPIVVKKINDIYVKNILTNKTYAIFERLYTYECKAILGEYVVSSLTPLESLDIFRGKTIVSETELRQMLTQKKDENSCKAKKK